MYDSVEEEQQEVDDKLAELEGVEGMHIDDLEAMQDNLFDMLLEHQASVNAIASQEENLCGICEQRHRTIKCRLLREQNIPPYMQRRIQQFRVKLKDQITKMDADDKAGLRQGSSRPPVPHPARIPGTRPVSFENPSVKAITSAQLNAHKMEVSSPQSVQMKQPQPREIDEDDKESMTLLTELIKENYGDDLDKATPIVANLSIDHDQQQKSDGLLVEFDDNSNLVPIHAEFEDDLVPSDFDAYGAGTVNW
jgi:hypothetical protein